MPLEKQGVRAVVEGFNQFLSQQSRMRGAVQKTDTSLKGVGTTSTKTTSRLQTMGKQVLTVGAGFLAAQASILGVQKILGGTIGTAIAWESAFVGVQKTVDATDAEFAILEKGIRDMSLEIPLSAERLAGLGEIAGQLGVQVGDLDKFIETVAKLGFTTSLSAEEAATGLARFSNIMGTSLSDIDSLGGALVGLGNQFAANESEILSLALRLAGAGRQFGLTEGQVLGLAAGMRDVGIEAEAGGTAISTVMIEIAKRTAQGGEALDQLAKVTGLTADEFRNLVQNNPDKALLTLVAALDSAGETGGEVFQVLEDLGLSGARMTRVLLSMTANQDGLTKAMDEGETQFKASGKAMDVEFNKRLDTAEAKLILAKQAIQEMGRELGQKFIPVVGDAATAISDLVKQARILGEITAPATAREIATLKDEMNLFERAAVRGTQAGLQQGAALDFLSARAVQNARVTVEQREEAQRLWDQMMGVRDIFDVTAGVIDVATTAIDNVTTAVTDLREAKLAELTDEQKEAWERAAKAAKAASAEAQALAKAEESLVVILTNLIDQGIDPAMSALELLELAEILAADAGRTASPVMDGLAGTLINVGAAGHVAASGMDAATTAFLGMIAAAALSPTFVIPGGAGAGEFAPGSAILAQRARAAAAIRAGAGAPSGGGGGVTTDPAAIARETEFLKQWEPAVRRVAEAERALTSARSGRTALGQAAAAAERSLLDAQSKSFPLQQSAARAQEALAAARRADFPLAVALQKAEDRLAEARSKDFGLALDINRARQRLLDIEDEIAGRTRGDVARLEALDDERRLLDLKLTEAQLDAAKAKEESKAETRLTKRAEKIEESQKGRREEIALEERLARLQVAEIEDRFEQEIARNQEVAAEKQAQLQAEIAQRQEVVTQAQEALQAEIERRAEIAAGIQLALQTELDKRAEMALQAQIDHQAELDALAEELEESQDALQLMEDQFALQELLIGKLGTANSRLRNRVRLEERINRLLRERESIGNGEAQGFETAPPPQFGAHGGFFEGGRPVFVGERGMELFVPGASGMLLPNTVLREMRSMNALAGRSSAAALSGPVGGGGPQINNVPVAFDRFVVNATYQQPQAVGSIRRDLATIQALRGR